MDELDSQDLAQDLAQETPSEDVFIAPSIHEHDILADCVLGVDEAGRGPVLGPMVYGLCYLPIHLHRSLLAEKHHFDDSKVLTPKVRSDLMEALCTPCTDLFESCGWATRVMSARDISSDMLKPMGAYNLNTQAMDATIELIKEVFAKGINVREIYIDTVGKEEIYQKKLERIFPTTNITVAKKADSVYPCVSAASVCAKVTRDAALEVGYQAYRPSDAQSDELKTSATAWGSGYPSDARAVTWLKHNMDPLFGWGNECRFSWRTAKDILEAKNNGIEVTWPDPNGDPHIMRVTDFYVTAQAMEAEEPEDELTTWYGKPVAESVF